jgi:hypothetical protein
VRIGELHMQLHNPRIEGGEAEGKETELGQLKGQVGKMARKDRMTKEREQRTKERRSGGRKVYSRMFGVGVGVGVVCVRRDS